MTGKWWTILLGVAAAAACETGPAPNTGAEPQPSARVVPQGAAMAQVAAVDGSSAAPVAAPAPQPPCINCSAVNEPYPNGIPCPTCIQPRLNQTIPSDVSCTSQQGVNCFAWSDFIALNWPVPSDGVLPPAAAFGEPGTPGNFQQVVWQRYKETSEVFLPDGKKPQPWGQAQPVATADACNLPRAAAGSAWAPAMLKRAANLRGFQSLGMSPVQPGGLNHWLADKNGKLVWYEVKINRVEFEYIRESGVYSAKTQWDVSQQGKRGVKTPVGSIEVKAAWRQITDAADYKRYLMTDACIPKPGGGSEAATLGLAGLHIIHKVKSQPQWVWASFEHVDNAPTKARASEPAPPAGYSFYRTDCKERLIPGVCFGPRKPAQKYGCDGQVPPYSLDFYFSGKPGSGKCGPFPIQVTQLTPIPDTPDNPIKDLNTAMRAKIQASNPDSVFQYYGLVNVMWWSTPAPDNMTGGAAVPLVNTGLQPSTTANVASTVLETYAQKTNCLTCHADAAIAKNNNGQPSNCGGAGGAGGAACASDFSFIFDDASWPKN